MTWPILRLRDAALKRKTERLRAFNTISTTTKPKTNKSPLQGQQISPDSCYQENIKPSLHLLLSGMKKPSRNYMVAAGNLRWMRSTQEGQNEPRIVDENWLQNHGVSDIKKTMRVFRVAHVIMIVISRPTRASHRGRSRWTSKGKTERTSR